MTSRRQFFRELGIVKEYPDLDKITEKAYADVEEKIWRENLENEPHGRPWFTSFHASSFPDDEKFCSRKLLYTMMDIPNEKPFSPFLRGVTDIGKAVEYQILYRWAKAGILLGAVEPEYDGAPIQQERFEDEENWLTGSIDAILDLRPEWEFVTPVDIKSKNHDVIMDMRFKKRGYEKKHYLQVQAYMYLCNKFHEEMGWDELGLQKARGAYIYYVSRQDPRTTATFFVDINQELIDNGIEQLSKLQESFKNDELPERDKSWKWTEEPCKWCDFKKHACKPDYKDKVTNLSESNAIGFAQTLRTYYDYEATKKEVLKRWE